ncbi:MAG: IS701 family transposase [Armatimonadia bacterium]
MDWREIEGLAGELSDYLQVFDGCFARSEGREHLRRYTAGQLSELPRKSVEPIADWHGIPPRTLQDFLATHRWDHSRAWEILQRKVASEHADEQAVGVIDETSFPKCGDKTVGVQRQYCGALGKKDNCVVSVHLGYCWDGGRNHCTLASDLYLPVSWLEDRPACREAGVPEELTFRTKWQIALDLIRSTLANGVRFAWLTFDEGYGEVPQFLEALTALGQRWMAEVPKSVMGWLVQPTVLTRGGYQGKGRPRRYPRLSKKSLPPCRLDNLLKHSPVLREMPWQNFYIKDTHKGPLVWQAKAHRFHLKRSVQPEQRARRELVVPSVELWLVIAQNPLTGEIKYFLSNAAAGVPLEMLLRVAFSRWHIERCFQDEKGELGLDHFECRRYVAVQRHLLLTAISHLFLACQKRRLVKRGEKGAVLLSVGAGHACGVGHGRPSSHRPPEEPRAYCVGS